MALAEFDISDVLYAYKLCVSLLKEEYLLRVFQNRIMGGDVMET
jgi:hypothetical protein